MKTRLLLSAFSLQLSALLFSSALAQGLPDGAPGDVEVVTLPEFQVSSDPVGDEYIATSTSGTRLGEDIQNLPFNIDAVTSEMMEDFQLDELEDLMEFMGGAGGDPGDPDGGDLAAGSYGGRVRGFAPLTVRDGFQYAMPATFINTSAVRFIRGPQSVFYGRAEPGGIINRITARPSYRPAYRGSATYAAPQDFYRASIAASGPIIKNKFLYRAYFSYNRRQDADHIGDVDFADTERYYMGASFLYRFNKNTTLYFSGEYQPTRAKSASRFTAVYDAKNNIVTPRFDSGGNPVEPGSNFKITRGYKGLGEFNAANADNAYRDTDYYGFNLLFNHRLNKTWEHRSALQTYNRDVKNFRWSGAGSLYLWEPSYNASLEGNPDYPRYYCTNGTFSNSPHYRGNSSLGDLRYIYNTYVFNGTFSTRTPYYTNIGEECLAVQSDLKGSFKLPCSSHTILFAADASIREREIKTYNYSSAYGGPPLDIADYRLQIDEYGNILSNSYYSSKLPSYNSHRKWYDVTTDHELSQFTAGGFASYRGIFFRNRLHVMAGLRIEHYSDDVKDKRNYTYFPSPIPPAPGGSPLPYYYTTKPKSSGTKLTYSAGATYQLAAERLSFYVSTATSYRPKMEIDKGYNTMLPPQEALSFEGGIKGVIKKNKKIYSYTLSFYDMTLENVAIANDSYNDGVDDGLFETPQYLVAGEQRSRGIDLRLVYIPTSRFLISYALNYCDNEVTQSAQNNNTFVVGKPTALIPKWSTSFFARYAFGGKLRGLRIGAAATWSDRATSYYETLGAYGAERPSYLSTRAFVTYRYQVNKRNYHDISLNVSNLLDRDRYTRTGRPYQDRGYRLSYIVQF